MEASVLGPFGLVDDEGRRITVGGGKEAALAAILATRSGEALSSARLIDALWGEDPPRTAARILQGLVYRLRKAGVAIDAVGGGYRATMTTDAGRFTALLNESQADRAQQAPRQVAERLRSALELWKGPALAEFDDVPFLVAEATRLSELRSLALEERIDADLALGRHGEVVAELAAVVEQHPYRERLWYQLIVGLYRSGRQADALAAYRRCRARLVDDLGVEPGGELQKLERAVLDQDPALDLASEEGHTPSGTVTVLATDIEGSTARWEAAPEAMARAIARHDQLILEAVEQHAGQPFKATGDGHLAVFAIAADALAAAIAAQRSLTNETWSDIGGLPVRVAVATGTAAPRGGDWFGPAVNRAARLLAATHGGQVTLDASTERLTHGTVPSGVKVRDLGRHVFKGLPEPELVHDLDIEGVPCDFPPLVVDPGSASLPPDLAEPTLVERDSELEVLRSTIGAAARKRGGVVVLEGEAGIGKSSLLAAAEQLAAAADFLVLRARGAALERAYAHGGLRQLFDPVLRAAGPARRAELLTDAAAFAAPALGFEPAHEVPAAVDEFAVHRGLYWLVDSLAASQPLFIVVDDAQWVDDPTMRALVYLARRVDDLRAVVAFGWRLGEPSGADHLNALRDERNVRRLMLRPLSESGSSALIAGERPGTSADLLRACHRAAGGNPFLIGELVRALPEGADPSSVTAIGPAEVARSVHQRLARLDPGSRELASAVAVLDADAELRVAAAVARIDHADAVRSSDALVSAGLFAPGRPLRFAHPLLRSSVYGAIGEGQRGLAHRRAAEVLAAEPTTADRAAAHLLLVPPSGDAWVTEHLRVQALRAIASGAPGTARLLLERAVEEQVGDDDAELLLALGTAMLAAAEGDPIPVLRRALDSAVDPIQRARAASDLSQALGVQERVPDAVEVLRSEAARLASSHPSAAVDLLSQLSIGLDDDDVAGATASTLAELVARGVPDSPSGRRVLISHAYARALIGDGPVSEVQMIAAPAMPPLWWREHPRFSVTALYGGLCVLAWTNQLDRLSSDVTAALRDVEQSGEPFVVAALSHWSAHACLLRGDVIGAEEAAHRAVETAPGEVSPFLHLVTLAGLVQALVARGRAHEADRALADRHLLEGPLPATLAGAWLAYARCELHLVQRRHDQAVADAMLLVGYLGRRGGSPPGWGGPAQRAMAGAGHVELARDVADQLVLKAEAWDERECLGIALGNAGRLRSDSQGLEQLTASVDLLEGGLRRADLADSLIALGAALRASGYLDDSRAALRRGLELAHHCGATLLVSSALEEMRLAGVQPGPLAVNGTDTLTPTELRVARHAGAGMSDPEIGQALFLTRSTVEDHVRSALRKLGVASRDEMAGVLDRP